jgi:hypothetical protein
MKPAQSNIIYGSWTGDKRNFASGGANINPNGCAIAAVTTPSARSTCQVRNYPDVSNIAISESMTANAVRVD